MRFLLKPLAAFEVLLFAIMYLYFDRTAATLGVTISQSSTQLSQPKKRLIIHKSLYTRMACMVMIPGFDDLPLKKFIGRSIFLPFIEAAFSRIFYSCCIYAKNQARKSILLSWF